MDSFLGYRERECRQTGDSVNQQQGTVSIITISSTTTATTSGPRRRSRRLAAEYRRPAPVLSELDVRAAVGHRVQDLRKQPVTDRQIDRQA